MQSPEQTPEAKQSRAQTNRTQKYIQTTISEMPKKDDHNFIKRLFSVADPGRQV